MPKPKKRKAKNRRPARGAFRQTGTLYVAGLAVLGVLLLVGIGVAIGVGLTGEPDAVQEVAASTVGATIGGVTDCQHNPDFSAALGFGRVAIDTSRSRGKGLVLFDITAGDTFAAANIYQHETWDDAGDVGSYTLDGDGNLYVAPFPHIDLLENPPAAQNTIHRIDTESSEMAPFVELPAAQPASTQNPFGVVGLTLDCETDSLYAASIAGSSMEEERGRIYQIDAETGDIVSQLEGIDPYGLGVFNGAQGKRLYFGHARSSQIFSIALNERGVFAGQPRKEFSLAEFYQADALVARRITFRETGLTVDGFKFAYNLVPLAEQGPRPSFRFVYNAAGDAWEFVEVERADS